MTTGKAIWTAALVLFALAASGERAPSGEPAAAGPVTGGTAEARPPRILDLDECLAIARESNRTRPVSQLGVEIAESQLRQALSAYWPQVSARASVARLDEDLNFVFPSSSFSVPASTIVATTPIGQIPVQVPAQTVSDPEQDVKLMDRDVALGSIGLVYPIYTGGLRPALKSQARSGVEVARQEVRRTDLQLAHDVKRYYYGAVLAKRLAKVASDTLARMEVTLELTERLYEGSSARVRKTDYLRTKAVVGALRSALAAVRGNERLALAALTNALGLSWESEIAVGDEEIPFRPYGADLSKLVGDAYAFSPDWAKLEEGIKAAAAHVDEKKSGHLPQLAFIGTLTHVENSYDKGIVTPQNRDSWSIGLGLSIPLFNGLRTQAEVAEAKARLLRIKEQKVLLREGIALQVKDVFLLLSRSQEQRVAMAAALGAAEESRDLNERAYREDLVETKDVIEAQLTESFMRAGYEKALYDHVEAQARLELVVGRQVEAAVGASDGR